MIDSTYNGCMVLSRVKNAFRREENENHVLYLPYGKSLNDSYIVNEQGEYIFALAKEGKPVIEIINLMKTAYPEVDKSTISGDVYLFLQKAVGANLLRIKGMENMYNGEIISVINGYDLYKCNEGDFKKILNALNSRKSIVDITDSSLANSFYNPAYLRDRLFNFYEEFYTLEKNNKVLCLMGLLHGKLFKNRIPVVSRFIKLEESESIDSDIIKKYIQASLSHFVSTYEPQAIKIRLQLEQNDTSNIKAINGFKETGFMRVAKFADELGKSRDVVIYDKKMCS